MEHKEKIFCNKFLKSFDFNQSCTDSKVNKKRMKEIMSDRTSDVAVYIKEQVDLYTLANSYMTKDFIKFKLGEVVNTGDNQHKITAAKLLLEFEDTVDKTSEFIDLIKAIKG